MNLPTIWPQFFTATIQNWRSLLKEDDHKDIIIDCLRFMVDDKRIELNSFVVMSNHIHLIWQPLGDHTLTQIQATLLTNTAKALKKKLTENNPDLLEQMKVKNHDRKYQVWKRESLSIELFTEKVFLQKLEYIHQNPVVAGLVSYAEDYKYSSAKFYMDGTNDFKMVTHYNG